MNIDTKELKVLAEAAVERWLGRFMELPETEDFIAAANPATVLALLDEVSLLESYLCECPECGGEGQVFAGSYSYYGHMDPPEPNMDKCCECDGQGFIGSPQQLHSVIAERDQLKADNEALRKDANLHAQLQRAAEVIPGAWNIQIVVERHAGWIEVFDDGGNRVAFDGEGHLGEQVSNALEMVLAMAKEAGQ